MRIFLAVFFIWIPIPVHAAWNALGPFGGSASFVQVDHHRPRTVIAATSNAQLFRSDDSGDTWKVLPFPAEFRGTLKAFVVDAQVPDFYLVGMISETPEYSGLFLTMDGGEHWRKAISEGLLNVRAIAVWPHDSGIVAAGTENGVFMSRDWGKTWDRISSEDDPGPKPVVSLQFDPLDSNILYAGTPNLAWKTEDGGMTWRGIDTGMHDDSDVFSILIDSRQHQRVFATTCRGIYRSLDSGATWKKAVGAKDASDRTFQIVQHPLRTNMFFASTALGLIRSVDGGVTWNRLSTHLSRSVAFDFGRPDRIFLATDDAGILRSDDLGLHFEQVNSGFTNMRLNSLATDKNALFVTVLTAEKSTVFRFDPILDTWETIPEDQLTDELPAAPKSFLANANFHVYKIVSLGGRTLLAATSSGLMRSEDNGHIWAAAAGRLGNSTVRAIAKYPGIPGVVLAWQFGTIFVSKDSGRTWNAMANEADSPDAVADLAVLSDEPNRVFILTENRGVYSLPVNLTLNRK
jgi:photosystem II stability/assembly factor-like uncharacterized protein